MKILDILTAPWAIEPGKLLEIQAIYLAHARGEKADLAAIEARLGRPMANERQPYVVDQGVAVIPVEGVIARRANMFMDISGGVSTQLLQSDLQAALRDPAVHSIILAVDSPGGSVDGPQAVAHDIRAGLSQKPIVTVAAGMIASAAYLIGSAASRVYITDVTTVSGSIGVVASHTDYSKAQEQRGIKVTEITAGKYKRIASENAPLSKEGKATIQEMVDYHYSLFVGAVASNRDVSIDTVLADMADGRTFIGQQGIDAGLVDGIHSMQQVVAMLNADYAASLADPKQQRGVMLPKATRRAYARAPSHSTVTGVKPMDRTQLAAEHPALLESILAEGRTAGAAAERDRLAAIDAAAIPGHDALIAKLKADSTVTAGVAALQILAAERNVRVAASEKLAAEAPAPLQLVPSATVRPSAADQQAKKDASMSVEDRCKAAWDSGDAQIRADFTDLGAFTAYTKAQERGAVKVIGGRA